MTDNPTPKADLLAQLAAIRTERAALDTRELNLVAQLRQAGCTWQKIADTLGVQQPNAIRKFGPLIEETRTVRVRPNPEEKPAAETPPVLPTITPGCTINIPAGITGARPARLHVTAQRNNPDGSTRIHGRHIRANGTTGREVGVTLHPVHAPHITVNNPHDDSTTGITPAGRSYSITRTGSTVYVWGDSSTPREIRCGSDAEAAARFQEIANRARTNPEEKP